MKFNYFSNFKNEEFNSDLGNGGGQIIIDGVPPVKTVEPTIPIINEPPANPPTPPVTPPIESTPPTNGTSDKVVQIDDGNGVQDYILDDNGNATKDGVIVYSAEQIASGTVDKDDETVDDVHQLISQVSGLELLDEEGQPILFKDGVEGLAEREVYVKNKFYAQGQSEALGSLFNDNPDLAEMYSYKSKHGSLDGYVKQTDYNSITINETTTPDTLKTILRDHYEAMGNNPQTIEKLIKLAENDETLRVDAIEALESLKVIKAEKDKEAFLLQKQQQDRQLQTINNYYGASVDAKGQLVDLGVQDSLYDKIIKTGKIGNILLPKEGLKVEIDGKPTRVTRQDLFAYFYNDVETSDGYKTQAQIDEDKRLADTNQFLIQGIKNITGGDLTSLEKTFENVIRINNAKKIIKMANGKPVSSKPSENIDEQVRKGTAQIIIK